MCINLFKLSYIIFSYANIVFNLSPNKKKIDIIKKKEADNLNIRILIERFRTSESQVN